MYIICSRCLLLCTVVVVVVVVVVNSISLLKGGRISFGTGRGRGVGNGG